jgi:hypothetical protein
MNSTCTCNLCSKQIEFESSASGQTVACPHCGMDTILFIPQGQRIASTTKEAEMIYQEENVSVSKTILKVGLSTYPIAAISSFRVIKLPPNNTLPRRLATISVVFLIIGFCILGMNASADSSSVGAVILGWLFISVTIFILSFLVVSAIVPQIREILTGKPMFGLSVTTSAGDQIAVTSPNFETVRVIESALQKAIAMRG